MIKKSQSRNEKFNALLNFLKGKNAKEIAQTFRLKQTTIEFYIENIKEKLGATSKSSLIMTVFSQKIIQPKKRS